MMNLEFILIKMVLNGVMVKFVNMLNHILIVLTENINIFINIHCFMK